MPNFVDFKIAKFSDGVLTIDMVPAVEVGGWSVRCLFAKSFDASSSGILFDRYGASGYANGESGITWVDSGVGRFQITSPTPEEFSGKDAGPYAFQFERLDSGGRTPLTQGYALITPNLRK